MAPIYGKLHLQWPIHHTVRSVPVSICTCHSGSILHPPLPPRIGRFPSKEDPIERGGLYISASRLRLEWNGIGLDCRKRNTIVLKSYKSDTNHADGMKMRKIVEHVFLLKMKADLSEEEESNMLDFLYTSQYHMNTILAISLGRIAEPNANGYTHAVYMRFQKKEDLVKLYDNPYYLGVLKDHVTPHCYGSISVDYESQVQDDILSIFRRGEEFNYGVEFVLLFSVLQDAVGDAVEDAMITFHRLTHELEPLIVQKTQGSNFNVTDNDEYTHCAIIRFPSVEALEIFRNCSEFKDMWKWKFQPIIKKSLAIHFLVDPIGASMSSISMLQALATEWNWIVENNWAWVSNKSILSGVGPNYKSVTLPQP